VIPEPPAMSTRLDVRRCRRLQQNDVSLVTTQQQTPELRPALQYMHTSTWKNTRPTYRVSYVTVDRWNCTTAEVPTAASRSKRDMTPSGYSRTATCHWNTSDAVADAPPPPPLLLPLPLEPEPEPEPDPEPEPPALSSASLAPAVAAAPLAPSLRAPGLPPPAVAVVGAVAMARMSSLAVTTRSGVYRRVTGTPSSPRSCSCTCNWKSAYTAPQMTHAPRRRVREEAHVQCNRRMTR
jgi:hypothetical protein